MKGLPEKVTALESGEASHEATGGGPAHGTVGLLGTGTCVFCGRNTSQVASGTRCNNLLVTFLNTRPCALARRHTTRACPELARQDSAFRLVGLWEQCRVSSWP